MPLLLNYSCDTILPFKYDVKFESFSTCGILVRLDDERIKSQTGKHCFTNETIRSKAAMSTELVSGIMARYSHLSSLDEQVEGAGFERNDHEPSPASPPRHNRHRSYSLNTRSSCQLAPGISSFQPIKATRLPRVSNIRTSSCSSSGLPI